MLSSRILNQSNSLLYNSRAPFWNHRLLNQSINVVVCLTLSDRLPLPTRDPRDPRGGPPPPVSSSSSGATPHADQSRGSSTFPDRRDSGSAPPPTAAAATAAPGKKLAFTVYFFNTRTFNCAWCVLELLVCTRSWSSFNFTQLSTRHAIFLF